MQAEYTIDELARAAEITVRSVRVYHERGLLPSPALRGRIGYYGTEHLHRLQTISRLLSRGMKLNGIRELLEAWDRGEGLAEVLGVPAQQAANVPGQQAPSVVVQQPPNVPGHQPPGVPGPQSPGVPGPQSPGVPGQQSPRVPGHSADVTWRATVALTRPQHTDQHTDQDATAPPDETQTHALTQAPTQQTDPYYPEPPPTPYHTDPAGRLVDAGLSSAEALALIERLRADYDRIAAQHVGELFHRLAGQRRGSAGRLTAARTGFESTSETARLAVTRALADLLDQTFARRVNR
ncbi:MerR family transcriptional regulator [Nocardia macrotermitis]|uniref:HTH merR-type domain-containing protein n=1 Tax=Nocardia macrotermitis TaxID=2585198 RepID=A0A7K0DGG0_9NOCA|nr:MerR family transcriptional regulator [Nocardia macrotermitis]MQY23874.1 hypothetical protein [Nocardia macrotermitis]